MTCLSGAIDAQDREHALCGCGWEALTKFETLGRPLVSHVERQCTLKLLTVIIGGHGSRRPVRVLTVVP